MKIKNSDLAGDVPSQEFPDDSASTLAVGEIEPNVVGLDDDLTAVRRRIYSHSSRFEVIPIVGMGGIGKSTLARKLYDEATGGSRFDRCAWLVVSQQYSRRQLLLGLLQSLGKQIDDQIYVTDAELVVLVHKELYHRRYLLVVDDLWSTQAWDELNIVFPKESNGSRVLLTTRLLDVANYVTFSSSSPHIMQLLSETRSWELLEDRVFGKGCCPSDLEQIGRFIAYKCHGLPLTIVVVAGLLKKDISKEYWSSVFNNLSSTQASVAVQKVLSLSYEHLPLHLKPCFLYVTAFPEDIEINANRLIRLWVAEGFVEPSGSQQLEEVAEGYLEDLVGRSLVQISKKRYNGRIKAVTIHDLLRDFGISRSQEQRFHSGVVSDSKHVEDGFCRGSLKRKPRRLTIQHRISTSHLLKIDLQPTRSLLQFSKQRLHQYKQTRTPNCPLLRVHEAPDLRIRPAQNKSLHLRYLAFSVKYNSTLPTSLFKLRNLQTLIVADDSIMVPLEVLKMPSLRHLIFPRGCYLGKGRQRYSEQANFKPINLQTLSLVLNWEVLTRQTRDVLVNLKKLGVLFRNNDVVSQCHVENIVHLNKLEALKIQFLHRESRGSRLLQLLAFPPSLKRLTLYGTCVFWEDMSIVGSLLNLEVLKLRWLAVIKGEWNPTEGEFEKLKYLELDESLLQHWEADSCHFPSLEILVLKNKQPWFKQSSELEIPSGIGEIDTLKLIEVHQCGESLKQSAKQIQNKQREMGNEDLQVIIS